MEVLGYMLVGMAFGWIVRGWCSRRGEMLYRDISGAELTLITRDKKHVGELRGDTEWKDGDRP